MPEVMDTNVAPGNMQDSNKNPVPCAHWKVWSAADALDHGGSSSLLLNEQNGAAKNHDDDSDEHGRRATTKETATQERSYDALAHVASTVLRDWGHRWASKKEFQSILNKNSLLHEIEESLVAIQALLEWLSSSESSATIDLYRREDDNFGQNSQKRRHHIATSNANISTVNGANENHRKRKMENTSDNKITVIDLCCGKGIFSMLLSYMAASPSSICAPLRRINRCIMIEKATEHKGINWDHIHVTNEDVALQSSGNAISTPMSLLAQIPIEIWDGCNIHDEAMLARIESIPEILAVVGIHLCKTLGPRCISLFNGLGATKAPFLCLAPCCLPRIATRQKYCTLAPLPSDNQPANTIRINRYEPLPHRELREKEQQLRDQALQGQGGRNKVCYICQSQSHRVRDCPSLPTDEEKRKMVLKTASLKAPCWRCGVVGHTRSNCPSRQLSSKPSVRRVPGVDINLSSLSPISGEGDDDNKGIFGLYCELIASAIETPTEENNRNVEIIQTSLKSDSLLQHGNEKNWNAGRKSQYIVTMR